MRLGARPAPWHIAPMATRVPLSPQLMLDYLVDLGSALMSTGCPTFRLEELLVRVARHEGHEVDVFAVPTGLFVGLRTPEGQASLTTMVRVSQWSDDLERLAALDRIVNDVIDDTLDVPEARVRIREVLAAPPPWSWRARLAGSIAASAGGAVIFGGGPVEVLLAGLGGGLLRAVMFTLSQEPGVRVLENFLGGLIAALVAWLSVLTWPGHGRDVLVLSIIIVLLPGLTLTTGLSELTYRNLVAGTSRLMHAGITLLSLVFGIAVVVGLEQKVGVPVAAALPRGALPWPAQLVAIVFAAVGFGVLVGLPRRQLGVAVTAGTLVWLVNLLARPLPGPLAAFTAALVLALGANLYARRTSRPAQLFLMPGMLLLVPGALSFRSLDSLLTGEAVAGIAGLGEVSLIAGALVMGLLVANVALPPRKVL